MHLITLLITAKLVELSTEQQLIRQCTCDEVAPCESVAIQAILPCADQCQVISFTLQIHPFVMLV